MAIYHTSPLIFGFVSHAWFTPRLRLHRPCATSFSTEGGRTRNLNPHPDSRAARTTLHSSTGPELTQERDGITANPTGEGTATNVYACWSHGNGDWIVSAVGMRDFPFSYVSHPLKPFRLLRGPAWRPSKGLFQPPSTRMRRALMRRIHLPWFRCAGYSQVRLGIRFAASSRIGMTKRAHRALGQNRMTLIYFGGGSRVLLTPRSRISRLPRIANNNNPFFTFANICGSLSSRQPSCPIGNQ